jgi:hypothetical protein
LLGDPVARMALGRAAQAFAQSQHGATERTLDLLEPLLANSLRRVRAA